MAMKLAEIAARISAHLKRFEADPVINRPRDGKEGGVRPYWMAGSWSSGRYVGVRYVSYQGASHLTKQEALDYLEWLDAGNVGTQFHMRRRALR